MLQVKLDDKRNTGRRLLEESIFNKLCNLLDTPNPLGNDWCKLPSLLLKTDDYGCSVNIDSIRDKAGRERRSPTEIVLDLFFGKQSGKTKEETMDTLKCALTDMNRPDAEFAVDAITKQLVKWSDDIKGEKQGSYPLFTPDTPIINITDEKVNLEIDDKVKNKLWVWL